MQQVKVSSSAANARGMNRRQRILGAAAVAALVMAGQPLGAANSPDQVISGQTDLSSPSTYATPPSTTSDVEFSGTYTGATTFDTSGSALNYGTLDDLDSTDALTITNNNANAGSITLNTAANSLAPNAADLLYVAGGGNLSINNTSGQGALTLNNAVNGNFDDAGTLTIGAAINLNATTLTFTGAGATTINGAISGTGGLIFNTTGTNGVTLTGTGDSLTGAAVVQGGTLYINATGNTGNGVLGTTSSITVNSGGTIDITGNNDNGLIGSGGYGGKNITINSGGVLTSDGDRSNHLGTVVLKGGTLATNQAANGAGASWGVYNLDHGVISGGVSTTSTISAQGLTMTEGGGTIFNVASGNTPSGIDLNVTGYFITSPNGADTGLVKTGNGVMAMEGTNTYKSATSVNGGTLLLDFTQAAFANNILNNAGDNSALKMGGGTFELKGSATTADSQQMNGLTINPGASSIVLSANGNPLLLTLGAITSSGGTLDFTLPAGTQNSTNGIVTSSTPSNGQFFPNMTVGRQYFATVNSSGDIVAAALNYTNVPSGGLIPNSASNDIQIIGGLPGANTGTSGNTAMDSLTMSFPGPIIVDPGTSTLTIGSGGLIVGPGVGPTSLGVVPGTGMLTAGTGSAAQLVLNNNSSTGLTVNSVIANNGSGAVSLITGGTSAVLLTAANTFTGNTTAGTAGLILANSQALQNSNLASGNIVFSNLVSSNAFTVGGLTSNFSQNLTNSAGAPITLSFGGNGQSNTFSGALNGAGSLVKTGSGTQTFSATGSYYTGGLVINQGKVVSTTSGGAAGLGAGTITVNAGAILEGDKQDSFGYTSGQAPTTIIINGGTVQENTSGTYRITMPDLVFENGGLLNGNGDAGDANGQFSFRGNPVNNGATSNITVLPSANTAVIDATTIWMQATNTIFNVGRGTAATDLLLNTSLNNAGSFTKAGNGIMTLTESTTFSGVPSVNGGTLFLDFTSPNASASGILSGQQYINLGGGTVLINGSKTQAVTQNFYTTDLTAGASGVDVVSNGQPVFVDLYTIQYRNAGTTVDFVPPSGASSSSNGINDSLDFYGLINGIMGGFATANKSDWATIDSNYNIVPYTGYTDVIPGTAIPDGAANNVRINGASSGTLTLQNGSPGNTTSINSLLQKQSSAVTIDTGGGTLSIGSGLSANWGGVGGVLLAPGAGALTIGISPNSGTLINPQGTYANGNGGGELAFINNSSNPVTVNSIITDGGGGPTAISASGTGTVILAGSNTNTGPTAVNGTATLQVGTGGTNGSIASGGAISLASGTLILDRSDSFTLSGAISGQGALIQNGAGTVTLGANNSFSGGLTINSGIILSTSSGGSTAIGTGPVTVNVGGTLEGGAKNDAFGYTVGSSPSVININGGTVTEAAGASRMTLENLTFTNGGTLTNPASNTGDANGNFSFFGVNGTCTITVVGSPTTSMITATKVGIQNNVIFNVTRGSAASDLTITSNLAQYSGGKTVTFNGNGIVDLSGASSFQGGMIINGGQVISTSSGGSTGLGAGPVTVNPGATLLGGAQDSFGYTAGASPSVINIAGGAVSETAGNFRVTLPNITFTNGGTLTSPAGNNGDASGNYSLFGGTVTVNSSPNPSLINARQIALQAGTVTFNVNRGSAPVDLTVSSVLAPFGGAQGLAKTGSGSMSLTAPNTYTGTTAINSGLLLVNNTSGSGTGTGAVAVNSGGALAGTGTISGNTSVNAGGVISAGSNGYQTTGTLHLPGATTLASGSGIVGDAANGATYLWKINDAGNATGPGTAGNAVGWDLLALNTASVSGTGSYVTVEPISQGGGYVNQPINNFNYKAPYQWAIATLSGGGGTALAAQLHLDTNSLSTFAAANNANAQNFSITSDPNDVYISYSPAPEPTSLALLGLGAAGMLLRRRRSPKD